MNDFTIGALEGLSYAMTVINKHVDEKDQGPTLDIYAELEAAALKLLAGAALSFRDKVDLVKGLPSVDAVKPGDAESPGDVSVEVAPHEKALRIEVEGEFYDRLQAEAEAQGIMLVDLVHRLLDPLRRQT